MTPLNTSKRRVARAAMLAIVVAGLLVVVWLLVNGPGTDRAEEMPTRNHSAARTDVPLGAAAPAAETLLRRWNTSIPAGGEYIRKSEPREAAAPGCMLPVDGGPVVLGSTAEELIASLETIHR